MWACHGGIKRYGPGRSGLHDRSYLEQRTAEADYGGTKRGHHGTKRYRPGRTGLATYEHWGPSQRMRHTSLKIFKYVAHSSCVRDSPAFLSWEETVKVGP